MLIVYSSWLYSWFEPFFDVLDRGRKTSFLEFSMRRSHSRCFVRLVSILSLVGSVSFLYCSINSLKLVGSTSSFVRSMNTLKLVNSGSFFVRSVKIPRLVSSGKFPDARWFGKCGQPKSHLNGVITTSSSVRKSSFLVS